VLDPTLLSAVNILKGLPPGGTVLLNSPHPVALDGFRTVTADLTGIALVLDLVIAGSPVLDTSVLGALAKIGVITLDSAKRAIAENFGDARNVAAAEKAYAEVAA
jgi:pyruvate ferredoxin oxidoreductase gamma subunit